MKQISVLGFIFLISFLLSACKNKEKLVFGLKPPGMEPEIFAPNIISTNNLEVQGVFLPKMDEFYFVRQKKDEDSKNFAIRFENGEWKKIMEKPYLGEVSFSPDSKMMYLGNKYSLRKNEIWTEAKNLGKTLNRFSIMRLTASIKGTYFFDEQDTIGTIRYSKLVDGKRKNPITLGNNINTGKFISHPFIAPDESYLIWDCEKEDGYGGSDLYISFRKEDGSWSNGINMGEKINSPVDDIYGSVTSNGKYFIFNRVRLGKSFEKSSANIFWVDSKIINDLKNK